METAHTVISLFLAVVFLFSGLSKASGSAAGLSGTRDLNFPDGAARLVGILETLASIALLVGYGFANPEIKLYGFLTIWATMAGAIFFHFRANKARTAFPAMFLLILTTVGIATL